ncbi:MAG: hypothetical protein IIB57_04965 [Planctomycetes bacterium]|nr:hypothetical protein [Planctomycetota bacterium]
MRYAVLKHTTVKWDHPPDDRCRIADIDGDGDVDLVDFAVLQQAFTGSLYGSVMAVP